MHECISVYTFPDGTCKTKYDRKQLEYGGK